MPKSLRENLSLLHQRGSCSNLQGTEHSRYLSLLALKVAKPLVPLLLLSLFECLRSEWGACSCAPGSSTRTRTYLEALCDMSNISWRLRLGPHPDPGGCRWTSLRFSLGRNEAMQPKCKGRATVTTQQCERGGRAMCHGWSDLFVRLAHYIHCLLAGKLENLCSSRL